MWQTFGSGLKCQTKIHLNTECGGGGEYYAHKITTGPYRLLDDYNDKFSVK